MLGGQEASFAIFSLYERPSAKSTWGQEQGIAQFMNQALGKFIINSLSSQSFVSRHLDTTQMARVHGKARGWIHNKPKN